MIRREKKKKGIDGYARLKFRIFLRTALMMFAAVLFIIMLYRFFFWGHFANWVVAFLDTFIYRDYNKAWWAYNDNIRGNVEYIFCMAILAVFLAVLWAYLGSFTRYFNEINQGIDVLMEESAGDIRLSRELAPIERKVNSIRHTLTRRKLDAQEAERRKNDLVVYLAHDLKTPLTSVIGYLTLLQDEREISEELREKYLGISLDKAERLEELINEFFEITRFNLSDIPLEYSRVNLTRLLEQLVYEFGPMLGQKDLRCILEIAPDTMIKCDVDKLQRVFDNLLRNAVNYSFPHSEIRIAAGREGDNLVISFENRGDTIPEEKLERIFEQFYRLDASRSSQSGGAGLGLAIARQIVERHGGTLRAFSGDERVEFKVTLPAS